MGTNSFVNLPTVSVGYAATVLATTPADLSTFVTLGPLTEGGYANGQIAFVATMRPNGGPAVYVLQTAVSIAPDSFFVVPTLDDPTRQWVFEDIHEQGDLILLSPEIDLTVPQTVQIVPPINYRYGSAQAVTWVVAEQDGTITTMFHVQAGTDAGISNIIASSLQAPFASNNPGVQGVATGGTLTPNNLDMSVNGFRLQITAGAVLGTATVFKARLRLNIQLARF